ncbi:hypothetical protein CHLNCDRAFT_133133 [Chlorella variabilis]|uniref:Uncharacterized protein n=1 Tax=Chlorella variabilis TaxID=554065 RepID=E1Z2F5_CHLVA|nr:hypothetical protein CHLNCDRAFT_133133 [Chlorella variabilis]EFN59991.1 hypothetical protein CHLNCDRAFT_133133 [Chlorella variabilis]|eukprot:XP_005852093.1 hypothetical protein CHLNCDRAFT_133133 [Chlorella variabilis]
MRSSCLLQAKNAFEILSRMPQHGLGSKLSRTSWTDDCYWTIARVKLSPDGKHGKAWGVLTWRGEPQRPNAPTQMAGPLKRVWRAVQDGSQQQWQSIGVADTLRQEQQQAAAAEAPPAEETPAAVDKQASAA